MLKPHIVSFNRPTVAQVCKDVTKQRCVTEKDRQCKTDVKKECKTEFNTVCTQEIKEECRQWEVGLDSFFACLTLTKMAANSLALVN